MIGPKHKRSVAARVQCLAIALIISTPLLTGAPPASKTFISIAEQRTSYLAKFIKRAETGTCKQSRRC